MGDQFSKTFFVFLGIVLLLNLLQAYFTPLIYDEAYYWYYSQNMAWGYFDHPPMVALLAKIGGSLFEGEIGVRLLGCLCGVGTLVLLWLMVDPKDKKDHIPLFFLLCFSMVLFNAYGFLTLPDTPLLFFTALFLWSYKRFLEKNTVVMAMLLGLCMTAMWYSKYHAFLVVFFVLLSNLKLILNKYAWLAVAIALLVYIPHFVWLFENDFVSIKFHLFERPNKPYSFEKFTLGYILNLVANFGLLFPWFYWALFKTRTKDTFQRGLLFLIYGIILFFFVASFHRRAQAQWIIIVGIPMIIVTFNFLANKKIKKTWLWRIGIAGTLLALYIRAWLIYHPLIPFMGYETHGPKEWVQTLNKIVGDIPVVFESSYRRAAMYSFYSGNLAFSHNNIDYRRNQYSIDNSEFEVQHKKVAYVTPYATSGEFSYVPFRTNKYYGRYIDDFESFRKLKCYINKEPIALGAEEHHLKIYNPYMENIPLSKLKIKVAYLDDYKNILEIRSAPMETSESEITMLKANDTTTFTMSFPKPEKARPKFIKFSISENGLPQGINSRSIKVKP